MGVGTCFFSLRAERDRWALNEWKRTTVHYTTQWSDFLQLVGLWRTEEDLPAFGSDFVVQIHENGWGEK